MRQLRVTGILLSLNEIRILLKLLQYVFQMYYSYSVYTSWFMVGWPVGLCGRGSNLNNHIDINDSPEVV